jgi:cell division protein FtsZ
MSEVNEAAKVITASADEDAKIIFGAVINDKMKDEVKITVVATGFDNNRVVAREEKAALDRTYTPNSFIAEEEKEEKLKIFNRQEKKRSKAPTLKVAQAEPVKKKGFEEREEEDELGIPAFLRKKMM